MKLVLDSSRCTGCKSCELACAGFHINEFDPRKSRIRITNNPYQGESFINVCRNCPDHPCVTACQYDACTHNEKTGFIEVKEETCTRCNACVAACSYHAVFLDPITELPLICDGCLGTPKCVSFCYKEAIRIE